MTLYVSTDALTLFWTTRVPRASSGAFTCALGARDARGLGEHDRRRASALRAVVRQLVDHLEHQLPDADLQSIANRQDELPFHSKVLENPNGGRLQLSRFKLQ